MAAESTPRVKPIVSLRWYLLILILIFLLIVGGMWRSIYIHNAQFNKNEQLLSSKSSQSTNPLEKLPVDSTKTYKINENDLNRFNDHIQYLSEKVENEVKRTQENSEYDIDRINTFLAIGIGLLAIIGGLLPIFVNFFSKEVLEKQMTEFEKTCDGLAETAKSAKDKAKKAKEAAGLAKGKAESVSAEVITVNEQVRGANEVLRNLNEKLQPLQEEVIKIKEATKQMPYIDMLILQNAVAKIMTTDAMKLNMGNDRTLWVKDYLTNLTKAIENFTKGGFHSFENYGTKHVNDFLVIISELQTALRSGPIRWIPDGRIFQSKIEEVLAALNRVKAGNKTTFKGELEEIVEMLKELLVLFGNRQLA
jgi:hypothetical protein